MCYRCHRCRSVRQGIPLRRVIKIRPVRYAKKKKGWEIEEEVTVCPKCHAKYVPVTLDGKTVVP